MKNNGKIYYIHNDSNVTLFKKKKQLSDQCANKTFDTFNHFSTPTLGKTLRNKQEEQT